jgi:hypothetical protein
MAGRMNKYLLARRLYQEADRNRWQVAWIAYKTIGTHEFGASQRLADAIGRRVDTVERLAKAYRMFVMLMHYDSALARNLRRAHPYTRFSTVFEAWNEFEFPMAEAADYIQNFDGGNAALAAEIENKHGAPEWERRANGIYRMAYKLRDDFGAPDIVKHAAQLFIAALDEWHKHEQI